MTGSLHGLEADLMNPYELFHRPQIDHRSRLLSLVYEKRVRLHRAT